MNHRPVSIIVCTHNRADLLPGLIDQLRNQSYRAGAFEIIVVDNCSTDHTPQVVQEMMIKPGTPVRYVAESRHGITFVRNRGAEEAQYPYLAYIDDDCSIESDWLSQLVSGFDLHDDVMVVGGRVVLDWNQTERAEWLGAEIEPWLAENSSLGPHPRFLDGKEQVMEGNMALKRDVWRAAGGFLGMEQFGSRNMAAGEVLYLLHYVRQHDGLIAFVPQAVANHRISGYNPNRLLHRAYWQGISDGILDHVIYRRSWFTTACLSLLDLAATIILIGISCFFYIMADRAKGISYLARSIRRFSLSLCKIRLAGNWRRVHQWISAHPEDD